MLCKKEGFVLDHECEEHWHKLMEDRPKWLINRGIETHDECKSVNEGRYADDPTDRH